MTKKLLTLVTILAMSFQIASCTSSQPQDESQIVENADVEKIEAEEGLTADMGDAALADDSSLQAALGEAPPDDPSMEAPLEDPSLSALEEVPMDDVAAAPTLDESSLGDVPPPMFADGSDPSLSLDADPTTASEVTPGASNSEPEVAMTTEPAIESSGTNLAATEPAMASSKPAGGELKKINTTSPYKIDSGWVNTVYVARPGETIKDIAKKVFALDSKSADAKVKQLKKIAENSYLKRRSVRPGDKIYYVSPNRPDDSAKTLFYYEDMGMVPETYVAKKGDNLRKLAKEILGYDRAYQEMWTSNPVESKGKLSEGEVLRYWRSSSGVTTNMAQNSESAPNMGSAQLVDQPPQDFNAQANNQAQMMPPPPQPEMQLPPPSEATASLPPPPDMNMMPPPEPEMQLPPPPDAMASLPPPPPPPSESVPPPPVEELAAAPVKKKKTNAEEEAVSGSMVEGLDDDTMMSLGALGVLTTFLALALIHRKKKKAAEQAAAMSEEINVGT